MGFGEFTNGQIIDDNKYPKDFLLHLVYEAGAGEIIEEPIQTKVIPVLETKVKKKRKKKTRGSLSGPAQAWHQRMLIIAKAKGPSLRLTTITSWLRGQISFMRAIWSGGHGTKEPTLPDDELRKTNKPQKTLA